MVGMMKERMMKYKRDKRDDRDDEKT